MPFGGPASASNGWRRWPTASRQVAEEAARRGEAPPAPPAQRTAWHEAFDSGEALKKSEKKTDA